MGKWKNDMEPKPKPVRRKNGRIFGGESAKRRRVKVSVPLLVEKRSMVKG